MALKKSQLYSSLWSSCDELRGGMDASQYKDYVLTLLFMKYVSDRAGKPGSLIEVPKGASFDDMLMSRGKKSIGEDINKVIRALAEKAELHGVIDQADFNDEDKLGKGQAMVDRLSRLLGIFESLDFSANRADGDDLLGDAYEYLMRHFATESGKSKGQFYTPAEVSRIMASVIGIGKATKQDATIYDPTCGSGSLLLKAADHAPKGLSIYGQEKDNATWALAKMNMVLHGVEDAVIEKGDTIVDPLLTDAKGKLKTFDFAVANPPFSTKSWTHGFDPANDPYERFEYGIPPPKNGDYAFLLHLLKSLKPTGRGAIIMPHGVLFRGGKEAEIRKQIVSRGFVKGIIGLPSNLFYGTGIPACIVVLDKAGAADRKGVFMIDASRGFAKDGPKNRLREQDIHKIVDVFTKQLEVPRYSRLVPLDEIKSPANDYNLNLPRYIDSSEPEDLHDLDAHLNGGIPNRDLDALEAYWKVFPSLRNELFEPLRPGYSRAKVEASRVKPTILAHPEFKTYSEHVNAIFDAWAKAHTPLLMGLKEGSNPKEVIHTLSEDLLARFANVPLLDKYDVYQRLMDYWAETMQDDVYLISAEGWLNAAKPRAIVEDKDKKLTETPDLIVDGRKWKMDLLPPALIIARYFAKQSEALDLLRATHDAVVRELQEFVEENSGDEGLLEEAKNEKGAVTKASVKERLTGLGREQNAVDGLAVLTRCLKLFEEDAEKSRAVKAAQAELDATVLRTCVGLREPDAKRVAADDKWIASLRAIVLAEVHQLVHGLGQRLSALDGRYADDMRALEARTATMSQRVSTHLRTMGLEP